VVEKNVILAANQISKAIDTRLKELTETAEKIKEQSQVDMNNCIAAIEQGIEDIKLLLAK
jgi:hypothetical protein